MRYLIYTEKDLNTSFLVKPFEVDLFNTWKDTGKINIEIEINSGNPILLKSKEAMINSWKLYELEGNEDDYEIFPVKASNYNPEIHYAKFDFEKLEKLLNISDYKKEMLICIQIEQKYFIEKLNEKASNARTNYEIKQLVIERIEKINKAISSLAKLSLNSIQDITKNLYLKNYKETLIILSNEYGDYLPKLKVVETSLNKIVIHNKLNQFLTFENELILREFITKSRDVLNWNSKKILLVNFCRLLKHHNYIISNISIRKLIAFLEERYNINTGDQSKPSKFRETEKVIEGDFFFLTF